MSKIIKSYDILDEDFNTFERGYLEEIIEAVVTLDASDGEIEEEVDIEAIREAILLESREAAKLKVQEAYDEGLKRGTEAGREKFDEYVGDAAESLKVVAEGMKQARDEFLSTLEPQIMDLVRMIAERVLMREIKSDEQLILTTIRATLKNLVDREELKVRVNPKDLEVLRNEKAMIIDEFDAVDSLDIIPDENITSGGCVVESNNLQIDSQIDSQFEQIINSMME